MLKANQCKNTASPIRVGGWTQASGGGAGAERPQASGGRLMGVEHEGPVMWGWQPGVDLGVPVGVGGGACTV